MLKPSQISAKMGEYFRSVGFESVTPKNITDTHGQTDLVIASVQATNKGPGLQFRRFAKVLGEKYYGADLFGVLSYYLDYWAQFIAPSIERENAIMLARLEIERFVNLKICNELNLPPPYNETTDEYLDRLVYTYGVSIYELRKKIQICKM